MSDLTPTSGEILRRLDDQARATERVVAQLDSLAGKLEERYLPRGEYNEAREGISRRLDEIEKDIETQASFRRQVAAGFMVGALLLILNVIAALTLLRGGA